MRSPAVHRLEVAFAAIALFTLGCGATRENTEAKGSTTAPPPARSVTFEVATANRARESSGVVVGALDGRSIALVADADDRAIVAFDATTLEPLARTELDGEPRDLLAAADGRIFATLPERSEVVVLVAAGADGLLREVGRAKTSAEPLGMALDPEESTLFVVGGASHHVDALATSTLARTWSVSIAREPRAALVAADGKHAFIAHAGAGVVTVLELSGTAGIPRTSTTPVAAEREHSYTYSSPPRSARLAYAAVRVRDGASENIVVPLVQQATWGASPDGYGFERPTTPGPSVTDFDRTPFGGPCFDYGRHDFSSEGRSIFDLRTLSAKDGVLRERPRRPSPDRTCLLPRAAIPTSDGVVVACEGESAVLVVVMKDLFAEKSWRLPVGRGPSAIARVPATTRALVWSPLARQLSHVALDGKPGSEPLLSRVAERFRGRDPKQLAGREIFRRTGSDAISRDGVGCMSCHPDGRDDDLVWNGPLGKRRPPLLAGGATRRGPFGWGGEHASLEAHVAETVHRLGGKGLAPEELESLVTFLRTTKPPPSSAAVDAGFPSESERIARGRTVFESDRAACASCHASVDRDAHDVGTGGAFVTPTLAGVGARRALFHDGRFDSLDALLRYSPRMGGAAELSSEDRAALLAYLATL